MYLVGSNITPRRSSVVAMAGEIGSYAAVGMPEGSLRKDFYVEGNLKIHQTIDLPNDAMCIRFSADGTLVAAGLVDGTIKLHNADTGNLLHSLSDMETQQKRLPVTSLHFRMYSEKDKVEHTHILMATYASGLIKFWHFTSGKCVHTIDEARQTLASAFSAGGQQFVTAGADSQLHLYNASTKKKIKTLQPSDARDQMNGHRFRVLAVQFHPTDPNMFVSGGWDDTVQFWDVREKHAVRKFYGPHICGDALDIDSHHNHILTGSWRKDKVLQIWDFSSGSIIKEVPMDPMHTCALYCAQWLGRDQIVCGGTDQNMLRVLDRGTLNTTGQLVQLPQGVYCIDNDRSNTRLPRIACGTSGKAMVLKMEKKS